MKKAAAKGNAGTVRKAVEYIEAHLEEDLSLERIAGELHYSGFYLERIFRRETGLTLYQYIRGRRLTLAARALVETDRPVVEIACDARYGSQQAFTLAFSRLYHCTPAVYRKRGIFAPAQIRLRASGSGLSRPLSFCQGGEMAA